jgi:hypothetical protein
VLCETSVYLIGARGLLEQKFGSCALSFPSSCPLVAHSVAHVTSMPLWPWDALTTGHTSPHYTHQSINSKNFCRRPDPLAAHPIRNHNRRRLDHLLYAVYELGRLTIKFCKKILVVRKAFVLLKSSWKWSSKPTRI